MDQDLTKIALSQELIDTLLALVPKYQLLEVLFLKIKSMLYVHYTPIHLHTCTLKPHYSNTPTHTYNNSPLIPIPLFPLPLPSTPLYPLTASP